MINVLEQLIVAVITWFATAALVLPVLSLLWHFFISIFRIGKTEYDVPIYR